MPRNIIARIKREDIKRSIKKKKNKYVHIPIEQNCSVTENGEFFWYRFLLAGIIDKVMIKTVPKASSVNLFNIKVYRNDLMYSYYLKADKGLVNTTLDFEVKKNDRVVILIEDYDSSSVNSPIDHVEVSCTIKRSEYENERISS